MNVLILQSIGRPTPGLHTPYEKKKNNDVF